ncbi:hypothetical protein CJ030_MR6G026885 [Morella rubra]|uniref:Uncharacterized protein n=1 Tax=Morella rubra TaxID=262757 RepID=A0A6A1VFG5_9ROSI|nr:hypothetical protein CJ030_MR6G026885 [Morella rubra]
MSNDLYALDKCGWHTIECELASLHGLLLAYGCEDQVGYKEVHRNIAVQVKKVVIDLTAPEAEHGVRCSWGPPGHGGIQFRVLDAPSFLGTSKKGKAPTTECEGAKDKRKIP